MEEISQNVIQKENVSGVVAKGRYVHYEHSRHNVSLKQLLYIMLAASAIGQGSRMLYQGLFAPGTFYIPRGVDLWFDWGILLSFGLIVMVDQIIKVHKGVAA
jgi:hypothetical protein